MATAVHAAAVEQLVDVAAGEVLGKIVVGHIDCKTHTSCRNCQKIEREPFQDRSSATELIMDLRLFDGALTGVYGDWVGGCSVRLHMLLGFPPSTAQIDFMMLLAAPSTACAIPVPGLLSCDPIWVQFSPAITVGENWEPPLCVRYWFATSTKGIDPCGSYWLRIACC